MPADRRPEMVPQKLAERSPRLGRWAGFKKKRSNQFLSSGSEQVLNVTRGVLPEPLDNRPGVRPVPLAVNDLTKPFRPPT